MKVQYPDGTTVKSWNTTPIEAGGIPAIKELTGAQLQTLWGGPSVPRGSTVVIDDELRHRLRISNWQGRSHPTPCLVNQAAFDDLVRHYNTDRELSDLIDAEGDANKQDAILAAVRARSTAPG